MAKQNNPIQKVSGALAERPDFLPSTAPIVGMETMKQLKIFPRSKIVQKSAGTELLSKHGVGDILIVPDMKTIISPARMATGFPDWEKIAASPGFKFVPLFFYFEWLQLNPIEAKGEAPMIGYRTLDVNDPFVAKCRNQKLRQEPYLVNGQHAKSQDGKFLYIKNVENLCFISALYGHELGEEPFTINCARGNYWSGVELSNKISNRKASLFACVFEGRPSLKPDKRGDYIVYQFTNPSDGDGWIKSKDQLDKYEAVHKELEATHKAKLIGSNLDVEEPDDIIGAGPALDPNKKAEF